jgi:hypothetical protein
MKHPALLPTCALFLAACAGKPGDDECEKFADKMIELSVKDMAPEGMEEMMKAEMTKQRPDFVRMCKEEGTKTEVACVLGVSSMDEMKKCE